jgi:hypothetical protein
MDAELKIYQINCEEKKNRKQYENLEMKID